jgi:hypothetical protein
MQRLGYSRYVAQGGDWGNAVTEQLALLAPAGLIGIHTNMPAILGTRTRTANQSECCFKRIAGPDGATRRVLLKLLLARHHPCDTVSYTMQSLFVEWCKKDTQQELHWATIIMR